jgi:hypothetical protein
MSGFNYFDDLKKGNSQDWASMMNKAYMDLSAPKLFIFKVDKKNTVIDDLYGESVTETIFLPPFDIRGYYLVNEWTQMVGSETMPYTENQEPIEFVFNLQSMVEKHRELKNRNLNNIRITYEGTDKVNVEKMGSVFTVKKNGTVLIEYNLDDSENRTVKRLYDNLKKINKIKVSFEGENGLSKDLENFNEININNIYLNIFSKDHMYDGITDVLEKGDLILTDGMFLYQVATNLPSGNFGWDYTTFKVQANLRTMDESKIPKEYFEQIFKNEYGLRAKYNME